MPAIVQFLIFIFAITIGALVWFEARRLGDARRRRVSSPDLIHLDRRLLSSDDYWAGLAAGARFLGTYRSPDEIDTCWQGMVDSVNLGDRSEREFATGWMRSVRHMRQHIPA